MIGEIKLIENDFVQASTEFGDVRIPLNRMSAIDLADVEMDKEGKPVKDEDGNVISIKEEPRMWGRGHPGLVPRRRIHHHQNGHHRRRQN